MLKSKRLLTLLLAAALALSAAACGSSDDKTPGDTTPQSSDTDTTAPEDKDYLYYDGADLGGETFTVFNLEKNLWDMICLIQPDELTGEIVNDAIYNRNVLVKQKLNCEIEEVNSPNYEQMSSELGKLILADDDVYDAAYIPMSTISTGVTEGYYQCLNDIDTIHLDESWWDQVLLSSTELNGRNYFAQSSAHLMGWDSLWCIFFNEDMMDDLKLEYPYQLVRDGKWTLDKMQELSHAAANLNGDESFANTDASNCIYGCTTYDSMFPKLLFGFNVEFVKMGDSGVPEVSCNTDAFINACQKLMKFISTEGDFLDAEVYDNTLKTHSQNIFANNRTLFLGYELKMAQIFRTMESSFGILPFPKLDENQKSYRSTEVQHCAMFTIPVTNRNPEKVGLLFDALSFESDKSVLPSYFNVMVEQKGLRNDESIEMLNIIKETRSFDLGIAYSWTEGLEFDINYSLLNGNDEFASQIAAKLPKIQDKIDKFVNSDN
ncbi:MAG: hypothetical protein HFE63_03465 [Clostridiales bacterium]|nr:hypothetical protein [Clostridiales bacterium]